jgi:hypothetical protein
LRRRGPGLKGLDAVQSSRPLISRVASLRRLPSQTVSVPPDRDLSCVLTRGLVLQPAGPQFYRWPGQYISGMANRLNKAMRCFSPSNEKRKRESSHVWFNLSSSGTSFAAPESDLSHFEHVVTHWKLSGPTQRQSQRGNLSSVKQANKQKPP